MPGITFDKAMELVRRFAGLEKYPQVTEAQVVLAEAFQESSVNLEHATAVCHQFDTVCPKPSEIRNVAFDMRPKFQPEPPVCPKCQGSTWISVTRVVNGVALEGSKRCSCTERAEPQNLLTMPKSTNQRGAG